MAKTWIVERTHDGEYLTQLDQVIRWEFIRVVNDVGAFTIIVSGDFDKQLLGMDRIMEFWREPTGGRESLLGIGFVRYWEFFEGPDGEEFIRIGGTDQLGLFERRIVANRKESSYAAKTGPADDVIKEIVTEQYVDTANRFGDVYYSRSSALPAAHFSVAPDEGKGREVTKEFAWREIITVLQEIAEASSWPTSSFDGVSVFFDLEYTGPAQLLFRTYTDIRGIDRTIASRIAPVVFSKESGTLADPVLRWDYTTEKNMVYGGGTGQGASRIIDPENDPPRHNLSIWNYQEGFQDAREEDTALGVAFKAFTQMQAKRPFVEFSGSLLDTPQTRFGVDWGFGDRVTIQYKGFTFDGDVNSFMISVDENGVEDINATVKIEEAIEGNPD